MVPLLRLMPFRVPTLPLGICLGALAACVSVNALSAAPIHSAAASEFATEFTLLPDASFAEAWLAQHIPAGTALSDHPRFFAAAHEVFFDSEDNVLVFVFRSASPDRWVAWVSYDAERIGVIDTTATDL